LPNPNQESTREKEIISKYEEKARNLAIETTNALSLIDYTPTVTKYISKDYDPPNFDTIEQVATEIGFLTNSLKKILKTSQKTLMIEYQRYWNSREPSRSHFQIIIPKLSNKT
jgi:hypothetical protein